MSRLVHCDYCGLPAEYVGGAAIYPHRSDLHAKRFYLCRPCNAWAGCHLGTTQPLGRLADAALRRAKVAAHAAFDPLWQNGRGRRASRYAWLAKQLGIPNAECHIGMFDVATCERVRSLCIQEQLRLQEPSK